MPRGLGVADHLAPFGTTIFTEMTRLAVEHHAVNLAQGFPDFDAPDFLKAAAARAIASGENQYARMFGVPALNRAIADSWVARTGSAIDPDREITVTSGCTEGIAATLMGLLNPGDEVVLFEPFYDSYRAVVAMAHARARVVTLRPLAPGGEFGFDEGELRAAVTARTRAILVNTPHNPTGKVFTRAELGIIASVCLERDLLAITDEVYEHLVYEPSCPHVHLATLPGMRARTVTLSSLGKTFSVTGWKVGWVIAPAELSAGVRAAHQFLTFATATPFQHAAAAALREGAAYVAGLVASYRGARDTLGAALGEIGFIVHPCAGTYFLMADHTPLGLGDDRAFCAHCIEKVGVAMIPPSVFYEDPARGRRFVRFAFCKKPETLTAAIDRLRAGLRR